MFQQTTPTSPKSGSWKRNQTPCRHWSKSASSSAMNMATIQEQFVLIEEVNISISRFMLTALKRVSSTNLLLRTRLSPMVKLRGSTLLLQTWYELHSFWVLFPNLCGLKPLIGHATYGISCLQVLSKGRLHLKCSPTSNRPSAISSRSTRLFLFTSQKTHGSLEVN